MNICDKLLRNTCKIVDDSELIITHINAIVENDDTHGRRSSNCSIVKFS